MFKQLIVLLLTCFVGASCTSKEKDAFTIVGSVSPATADYIILKKETDIERKMSESIDTLVLDSDGNFRVSFTDEPYLYSLNFPNNKKIDIALNTGQEVTLNITGYDNDAFKATAKGSVDSEELLAYEVFRKESLERLVISVRNKIKELKKADLFCGTSTRRRSDLPRCKIPAN